MNEDYRERKIGGEYIDDEEWIVIQKPRELDGRHLRSSKKAKKFKKDAKKVIKLINDIVNKDENEVEPEPEFKA